MCVHWSCTECGSGDSYGLVLHAMWNCRSVVGSCHMQKWTCQCKIGCKLK
jgi:hypothetical protein